MIIKSSLFKLSDLIKSSSVVLCCALSMGAFLQATDPMCHRLPMMLTVPQAQIKQIIAAQKVSAGTMKTEITSSDKTNSRQNRSKSMPVRSYYKVPNSKLLPPWPY